MTSPVPTVYVVDDDTPVRRGLARLLRTADFAVETFASAEAFQGTDVRFPACLLLDIHLGGMSGLELGRRMAEQYPDLPVIYMTAHENVTFQETERGGTRQRLFQKPLDGMALLSALQEALSQSFDARSRLPQCGSLPAKGGSGHLR